MAILRPWIANTLIDTIDAYLAFEFEGKGPEEVKSVPFKYMRDRGILLIRIQGEPNFAVRLIDCQVSSAEGNVEAQVTDGEIEIRTIILQTALDVAQHSHARTADLQIGAVLELHDFEFRFGNSLQRPQVSLHLSKFDVLPKTDNIQIGQLLAIDKHQLARKFLETWQDFEESRAMQSSPSSPREIQSQIGEDASGDRDSDVENQDATSVSQSQFATQIPLRESPKTVKKHDKRVESFKANESHVRLGNVDQIQAKWTLHNAVNDTVDSEGVMRRDGDNVSASPDLTQIQIVVPSTGAQAQESGSGVSHQQNDAKLQKGTEEPSGGGRDLTFQVATHDVMKLLRALRKECYDGRYIPRRLQCIQRDQTELLESDDRWQPPLVGRVQRPGVVPLELLNLLTERADRPYINRLPTHTEPSCKVHESGNDAEDDVRRIHEGAFDRSDNESPSSEEIEWPSSPERVPMNRKVLPPDSSPLRPTDRQDQIDGVSEEKHLNLANTAENDLVSGIGQGKLNVGSTEIDGMPTTKSIDVEEDASLPSSALRNNSEAAYVNPPRTVQVKRTPFNVKGNTPINEMPDSSVAMIPGTFDERTLPRSKEMVRNTRVAACSSDKMLVGHNNDDFEMDTSEDEIAIKCGRSDNNYSQSATSAKRRAEILVQSGTESVHNEQLIQNTNITAKRKSVVLPPKPQKRVKHSSEAGVPGQASLSEYDHIDQSRARQRREVLGRIGRRRDMIEQAPPLKTPTLVETEKASSLISNPTDLQKWNSSPPHKSALIDTSDTHTSIYLSVDSLPKASVSELPASALSHAEAPRMELYDMFKLTYPDYGGQEKHFDAACQILKRLYLQDKATHQLLWDDFIFRHFHDYRSYLLDVMENCGDALSYEKFYQEYVEQPTCLQRLVRPAYINQMSQDPISANRPSLGHKSTTVPGGSSLQMGQSILAANARSIAADSSIGNAATLKKSRQSSPQQKQSHKSVQTSSPKCKDKHAMLQKNPSQESQSSVKIWLERAAGAESPILGTSEVIMSGDVDVSTLGLVGEDLNDSNMISASSQQKKRKSLPPQQSQERKPHRTSSGVAEVSSTSKGNKHRTKHHQSPLSSGQKTATPKSQSHKQMQLTVSHQDSTEAFIMLYRESGEHSNSRKSTYKNLRTYSRGDVDIKLASS